MSHGGLKRARSWKRRIQPKKALQLTGSPLLGRFRRQQGLVVATCRDSTNEAQGTAKVVGAGASA
jgi:hypothetical protein